MLNLKHHFTKTLAKFSLLYGRSFITSVGMVVLLSLLVSIAVFAYFNSAAPTSITIASGPDGSAFRKTAEKYKTILAKQGVTLTIVPSAGSADNLQMLVSARSRVDVGFVQGGDVSGINIDKLVSLGSINYQPLMVFYRGEPRTLISDFKGKRVDIGPQGSGTHALALAVIKANGIEGEVALVDSIADESVKALRDNRIDVIFVMGDSVSSDLTHDLLHTPGIHLFNFSQADAYTRRIKFLNKLQLLKGSLDLGKNIPDEDITLIGPTVELVARDRLHPALSDLLLETARQVHGSAGLYRKAGEFPAPLEHEFPISQDALRYYSSGKSFLYRTFPFWLASLINRTLTLIVPIVLLLIPGLKLAPAIYRWRIQSRIYPWYKALLELERVALTLQIDPPQVDMQRRAQLLRQLDAIELGVSKVKIPASFGDLFYDLRGHIDFVRQRLLVQSTGLTVTDEQPR